MAEASKQTDIRGGAASSTGPRPAQDADRSTVDEPLRSKYQDADALLERAAELLMRQAIDKALAGDMVALRLCVERFFPPRKERQTNFVLPDIEAPHDLPRATHALLKAISTGQLTPLEAAAVAKLIGTHINAIEATDVDERLTMLENIMITSKNARDP